MEKICEAASITLNRNAVHGDASALSPGGVRVGAPAMTTRGCIEQDLRLGTRDSGLSIHFEEGERETARKR